jgi:hypothetical protein
MDLRLAGQHVFSKYNIIYGNKSWLAHPPNLLVCDLFFRGYLFSKENVLDTFSRLTQSQAKNFGRNKCHVTSPVGAMGRVVN